MEEPAAVGPGELVVVLVLVVVVVLLALAVVVQVAAAVVHQEPVAVRVVPVVPFAYRELVLVLVDGAVVPV